MMPMRLSYNAQQVLKVTTVGDVTTSQKISNALTKIGEDINPATVASTILWRLNTYFNKELNSTNTMEFTRIK